MIGEKVDENIKDNKEQQMRYTTLRISSLVVILKSLLVLSPHCFDYRVPPISTHPLVTGCQIDFLSQYRFVTIINLIRSISFGMIGSCQVEEIFALHITMINRNNFQNSQSKHQHCKQNSINSLQLIEFSLQWKLDWISIE